MTLLSTYYIYTSTLPFLTAVCDLIFSTSLSPCIYTNSKTSLFLLMGIFNIIIFLFMVCEALLIKYYLNLLPSQIQSPSFIIKLLSYISKLIPHIIKVVNLIKTIICIICIYYAYINTNITINVDASYRKSPHMNATCSNVTITDGKVNSYKVNIKVFEGIEIIICVVLIMICGYVKKCIGMTGEFYEPNRKERGKIKNIFVHVIGP